MSTQNLKIYTKVCSELHSRDFPKHYVRGHSIKLMFNMKNDNPNQISLKLGRHVTTIIICGQCCMASEIGPVEVTSFPHILDLPYYFQLAIS